MPLDERLPIDDAVALDILFISCDESPELHEALLEIGGKFPEASLPEKYRAADRAIRRLHEMGLIEFYQSRFSPEGDISFEALDLTADEVLENPAHWCPGRYGYTITPKGERATLEPGAV